MEMESACVCVLGCLSACVPEGWQQCWDLPVTVMTSFAAWRGIESGHEQTDPLRLLEWRLANAGGGTCPCSTLHLWGGGEES